jgi:hypothetical protein
MSALRSPALLLPNSSTPFSSVCFGGFDHFTLSTFSLVVLFWSVALWFLISSFVRAICVVSSHYACVVVMVHLFLLLLPSTTTCHWCSCVPLIVVVLLLLVGGLLCPWWSCSGPVVSVCFVVALTNLSINSYFTFELINLNLIHVISLCFFLLLRCSPLVVLQQCRPGCGCAVSGCRPCGHTGCWSFVLWSLLGCCGVVVIE